MDGQNYVVFHNDSDDSYANVTNNFKGADVGTEFIDLYFNSISVANNTGYDKVRLEVLAGKEEAALEGVMAGFAGSKAGAVTIIADDVNSNYIHENVEAVTSITLASQVQTRAVEAITVAKELEASDSGKLFTISHASGAYNITLPTVAQAGAGWYAEFIRITGDSNAVAIINDSSEDKLIGTAVGTDGGTGTGSASAVDSVTFIAGGEIGDRCTIMCDGSNFYVHTIGQDADHVTIS
jgi:hypothetical protein